MYVKKCMENPLYQRHELVGRLKLQNTLPPLPSTPKLLQRKFDHDKLSSYFPITLENDRELPLLAEPELGIEVDLIHSDKYIPPKKPQLDEKDKELLQARTDREIFRKTERKVQSSIPYFKRTTYISMARKPKSKSLQKKKSSKEGKSRNGYSKKELTFEEKLEKVEESFEEAKVYPTHKKNPNLYVVEMQQLVPDLDNSELDLRKISFDTNPNEGNKTSEQSNKAILRGYTDSKTKDYFFDYMQLETATGHLEKYRSVREYDFTPKENEDYSEYIIVLKEYQAKYHKINSAFHFRKRKKAGKTIIATEKKEIVEKPEKVLIEYKDSENDLIEEQNSEDNLNED
ncbi:RNA polymerase ii-associated factor 1 [Anaeramoeba flamelloides]|uniref:RNA polymerase ii-associated factor 1 n=1 Tax=Anaeramoeba flamelloides TaxID=1746091 RepID=A0AAV7YXA0_9EUKA|nr:RNA polymerase ii-associated factor 1 [Anaeramoeba flamelloides]KAJ6249045.1 RNA polymerase ii-associated factor 1 [Anaeramoeba flamelloides]